MLRNLIKLSAALSFLLLLNGAYFEYVVNRDIVPGALAFLALVVVLGIDAMVGYYLLKFIVKLLKIKSE